ncbi:MAG: molybdopterin dehydrogenase [Spirochaetales bacterium]|nr:molybdopterin dehydrogenase [Spirochaetales bacterium]
MPVDSNLINIFSPQTLGDLLALKKQKPDIQVFAGGTYVLHGQGTKFPRLPGSIVSISQIEELSRIHRTERYLELGSCVTLSKIGGIGGSIVPSILIQAIEGIASPPVRNLATFGGNICVQDRRLSTYPVLFLLDARVELRELGESRWIPINRLSGGDDNLTIRPSEILTRIRVPLGEWNVQIFRNIGDGFGRNLWSLSFCGLANIDRAVLSDFRFAFGSLGKNIIRNREIEAELVGRKLPLQERDRDLICLAFHDYLNSAYSEIISSYQRSMALKLFKWFLFSLELK